MIEVVQSSNPPLRLVLGRMALETARIQPPTPHQVIENVTAHKVDGSDAEKR
jgi:hypothetical protein